jgi:hypothetical protein
MKYIEKLKAIELRKQGKSYKEILTEIKVAKATLSLWLRDVALTKEQQESLYALKMQGVYREAKRKQQARIERTKQIFLEAKNEIGKLSKNTFFLCGVMLYWAEGAKTDQNSVKFTNSDPQMISLMIKWFTTICKVPKEKMRVDLHIHELHDKEEIEYYWSDITGIPLNQFYKTQIKPTSLGHRKKMLYNGTCSIVIGDRALLRRIKGWTSAITEDMDKILKIR